MSNIGDPMSGDFLDTNKPSTSLIYEPQVRSLCTDGNASQKDLLQSSKNKSIESQFFFNSSVSDISTQCKNIDITSNGEEDKVDTTVEKVKKNAKKKVKYKKLELNIPDQHLQNSNEGTSTLGQCEDIKELFVNKIAPLYGNSYQYLENISNHPQFKYMQQTRTEVYSSQPFSHNPLIPSFISAQSRSPQYLENMLQHPLLSQSLYVQSNVNGELSQVPKDKLQSSELCDGKRIVKHTKKRKKKTKQNDNDNHKFEPYISIEEVDDGLKDNIFIEGVLRINPKQFQHSYVSGNDRSEKDVLIDSIQHRNRAFEGDVVIVQLIEETDDDNNEDTKQQKRGKVVYLKENVHPRTCIGTLKLMPDRNRQKALFVPRDHRIPRLNIPYSSWPDNFYKNAEKYENTLFLAKIIDWVDTRFALGTIMCRIGQSGDMKSETKAILAQNDLDITPFGPEVRELYPRLDYVIPEEEIALREDCRSLCLFSIDPFNCRDIDDAVSCKQLDNGNYEVGVHISDVAHFLRENTILDDKVADKATTIYLVETAYHMLPEDLCMLCSLFPGVDKLAFSVFWEITEDAVILNHRITKTVIHSCCQLAYDHAQAVLDDEEKAESEFPEIYNDKTYAEVYKSIKILGKISAKLRDRRFENGALRIDQPKVSFSLNPADGLPESFYIYESKHSHQLIEEYMLLANTTVAKHIYCDYPQIAFLRCHPPPSTYMMKQLTKQLLLMGIELDISSAGTLYKSLLPHVGPENTDRGKAMVLNMLYAKPMTRAKYFCANGYEDDDLRHYALNVPLYTHFTSPIRRYADVMVHRLLAASLKYREKPDWEIDRVQWIAAQCNKQKYNAKKAGEMSTELYTLKYIETHSPVITEAVVVEVREKYIDVIIVAMGLNRRIFFNSDFPGQYHCIKNDAGSKLSKMEIIWNATDHLPSVKQMIEVFSVLNVEMYKGDEMVKVETKLVRP